MPDTLAGLLTQDDQVITTDPASGLAKVLAWLTGPEGGLSNAMGMKPWNEQSPMDVAMGFAPNAMAGMGAGAIRAYHGSPHNFDKFDMSKIGTGEGAQAYGHGLYFAGNEGVARGYRDALAADNATIGGRSVRDLAAEKYRMGIKETPSDLHNIADYVSSYQNNARYIIEKRQPELLPVYDKLVAEGTLKQGGRMYEVDIHADPAHLLDWDKPLSGQPAVQQKLAAAGVINPRSEFPEVLARANTQTGGQVYESSKLVPGGYRDPKAAAAALGEMGIPGIRYLDQGSRNQTTWTLRHPQGGVQDFPDEQTARAFAARNPEYSIEPPKQTNNYVMFDDKLIDIIRKYGLAGLLTSGVATMGSDEGMTP